MAILYIFGHYPLPLCYGRERNVALGRTLELLVTLSVGDEEVWKEENINTGKSVNSRLNKIQKAPVPNSESSMTGRWVHIPLGA